MRVIRRGKTYKLTVDDDVAEGTSLGFESKRQEKKSIVWSGCFLVKIDVNNRGLKMVLDWVNEDVRKILCLLNPAKIK